MLPLLRQSGSSPLSVLRIALARRGTVLCVFVLCVCVCVRACLSLSLCVLLHLLHKYSLPFRSHLLTFSPCSLVPCTLLPTKSASASLPCARAKVQRRIRKRGGSSLQVAVMTLATALSLARARTTAGQQQHHRQEEQAGSRSSGLTCLQRATCFATRPSLFPRRVQRVPKTSAPLHTGAVA